MPIGLGLLGLGSGRTLTLTPALALTLALTLTLTLTLGALRVPRPQGLKLSRFRRGGRALGAAAPLESSGSEQQQFKRAGLRHACSASLTEYCQCPDLKTATAALKSVECTLGCLCALYSLPHRRSSVSVSRVNISHTRQKQQVASHKTAVPNDCVRILLPVAPWRRLLGLRGQWHLP